MCHRFLAATGLESIHVMYMTCICGRITYTGSTALALGWHSCFHGAQLVDNLEIVGMEIWSRVIVCRAWDT